MTILLLLVIVILIIYVLPIFWCLYTLPNMSVEELLSNNDMQLTLFTQVLIGIIIFITALMRVHKNIIGFIFSLIIMLLSISASIMYNNIRASFEITVMTDASPAIIAAYKEKLNHIMALTTSVGIIFIVYVLFNVYHARKQRRSSKQE